MDFLTLARERFSVLEYEYRDVEAEKLEKILAARSPRRQPAICSRSASC